MDSHRLSTHEEKLKSAKQKLKQYRAKQHAHSKSHSRSSSRAGSKRASGISNASSAAIANEGNTSMPPTPTRRQSFSRHNHRRSLSRTSLQPSPVREGMAPAMQAAASANAAANQQAVDSARAIKRQSMRHSRTGSILNAPPPAAILSPSMSMTPNLGPSSNKRHSLAGRRHSRTESILSQHTVHSPEVSQFSQFSNGMSHSPIPHSFSSVPASGAPTDRFSALHALEGTTPRMESSDPFSFNQIDLSASYDSQTPVANSRASWGLGVSTAALSQSRTTTDLDVLLEEEEEEEITPSTSFISNTSSANQSNGSPARLPRQRPSSLFLPPSSRAPLGPAYNAHSPLSASAYDQSAFTPTSSEMDSAATTPMSTTFNKNQQTQTRGLRNLSLSLSNTEETRSQRRLSGFKSFALGAEKATSPINERASPLNARRRPSAGSQSMSGSTSVFLQTGGTRRRSSVQTTPHRRPSSSRSLRPEEATTPSDGDVQYQFGDLVMQDEESSEFTGSEHSFNNSINSAHSPSSLHAQIANLKQETQSLRQEIAKCHADYALLQQTTADQTQTQVNEQVKHLTFRLFEAEGQLEMAKQESAGELAAQKLAVDAVRAELAESRESLNDVVAERDDLREDVEGWRLRCASLERSVQAEKAKVEDERREGMVAREKARKLGDRLAVMNSSTGGRTSPTNDSAPTEAHARLISEMRDQIMNLAKTLECERRQHAVELASQHRAHVPSDASVTSGTRSAAGSLGDFSMSEAASSPASMRSSFGSNFAKSRDNSDAAPLTASNLGGLHTLTEEDEEEAADPEQESSGWTEEDETNVPELDYAGTINCPEALAVRPHAGSVASSCGDIPKTPVREAPPRHARTDSFIKQWTFPSGPVDPFVVEPDDHTFFSLATAEVLPPLPLTQDALVLPAFFDSGLVIDEVKARAASPVEVIPARMSLQNLGSLISNYVVAPGSPPLCHTREESVFTDDHQQLLDAPPPAVRKTVVRQEQPTPMASALRFLDFRALASKLIVI